MEGKTTAIVSQGRKKLHTTYSDGSEMIEEYDVRTDELMVRKRRGKSMLGKQQEWRYEVGQESSPGVSSQSTLLLRESNNNPIVVRQDTRDIMRWRIRNLIYPKKVYDVSVNEEERRIIVRTSNRKYFKKLSLPDLDRYSIGLDSKLMTWSYANNTLIIEYEKPCQLIKMEEKARAERADLSIDETGKVDSAGDCKQQ